MQIIAYSQYIKHGIKLGMGNAQEEKKIKERLENYKHLVNKEY
ncbi:hypothetical protein [Clostridium beijerinckii]|nr:hypothetical protein [Clostridium beijerinckii]NRT77890.1 hypothetical protein [Clostridium beijerinckii]